MRKNIIAVCDSDAEYACNFAEYLNSKKKLPFQAEAFTNVEKLRSYAGKCPPEILLISEADASYQIENLNAENVILLSDERTKGEEGYKCIYKYQSADAVINEVMEYYTKTLPSVLCTDRERKLLVLGVYSPVNRCGKTLFSLTAGQILGETKSVLYLNLEDYSGLENLFQTESDINLTDLFYTMRCREEDMKKEMSRVIRHFGKTDYIPPAESPEDVREIQFSEWMKLFDWIRTSHRYEVMILDIGNSVDKVFQILNLCSRIYMPVQEDFMSCCKLQQFKKAMQNWGMLDEEKIREVRLPLFSAHLSEPQFWETLTWGVWGNYVRKVLETDEGSKAGT